MACPVIHYDTLAVSLFFQVETAGIEPASDIVARIIQLH
jgi:hypothetical protein